MATKSRARQSDTTAELLKDLLIVELGKAGVAQQQIRQIVGGDINRVNRIVKFLKKKTRP
jgi:hypothetical protein